MSSPKQFNDPFDSKIKFNYSLLSLEEQLNYIKKLLENGKKHFDKSSIVIPIEARISLMEKMMIEAPEQFQKMAGNLEIELINKIIGIESFSCVWKNILMWSHYAHNHTGYCVGLNEEKLRNSQSYRYGAKVNYPKDNSFPKLHPLMNEDESFYFKFFTKSIDWKYEEEYRLINLIPPESNNPEELRTISFDPSIIEEIIIGLKMSENDAEAIIDIAKKHNINVYRAKEIDFQFALDRELIFKKK